MDPSIVQRKPTATIHHGPAPVADSTATEQEISAGEWRALEYKAYLKLMQMVC